MRLKTGAAFTDELLVAAEDKSVSQPTEIGLCADCEHMRRVVSDRGATFYLCARALSDTEFAKYPRLPVVYCRGYKKRNTSGADPRNS